MSKNVQTMIKMKWKQKTWLPFFQIIPPTLGTLQFIHHYLLHFMQASKIKSKRQKMMINCGCWQPKMIKMKLWLNLCLPLLQIIPADARITTIHPPLPPALHAGSKHEKNPCGAMVSLRKTMDMVVSWDAAGASWKYTIQWQPRKTMTMLAITMHKTKWKELQTCSVKLTIIVTREGFDSPTMM